MSLHETLFGVSYEQAFADDLVERMAAGDEEALALYAEHQRREIGDDLGDLEDWPGALDVEAATVLDVPRMEPLYGWRYWHVTGSHLASPFWGVRWRPGVNTSSSAADCGRLVPAHPAPGCLCGIRVMQSRTLIETFADRTKAKTGGPLAALARVAVWGTVVGHASGDDWQYTIRARHARIVGPLFVAPGTDKRGLARRYAVPIEPL